MPHINVELSARTVEATVTLNVSSLNDILRILIDQANAHETTLDRHNGALEKATARIATLEQELAQMRPDGDRINELDARVKLLREGLDATRESLDVKVEGVTRKVSKRVDALEASVKEDMDAASRRAHAVESQASAANQAAKDVQKRLDGLAIPDVGPLEAAVAEVAAARAKDAATLEGAKLFQQCWDADTDKMRAAVNDAKDPHAAKVEYVRSRPPFAAFAKGLEATVGQALEGVNGEIKALREALTEKVDKTSISDLLHGIKTQMRTLQETADFIERRMQIVEGLPQRVGDVEDLVRALQHGKADGSMLDLKADQSALHAVAGELNAARDDIDDLFARIERSGAKGGGTAAPSMQANRRASNAAAQLTAVAIEDLRKRVCAVEGEAGRLERAKAERAEMLALDELCESMRQEMNRRRCSDAAAGSTVPARTSPERRGSVPLSPSAPAGTSLNPLGTERRPPRASFSSPGGSRPGSSRQRSPPGNESRPGSAARVLDVRPIVTPLPHDTPSTASPSQPQNNSWHLARGGSVAVRDSGGHSTPALISGGHVVPVAFEEGGGLSRPPSGRPRPVAGNKAEVHPPLNASARRPKSGGGSNKESPSSAGGKVPVKPASPPPAPADAPQPQSEATATATASEPQSPTLNATARPAAEDAPSGTVTAFEEPEKVSVEPASPAESQQPAAATPTEAVPAEEATADAAGAPLGEASAAPESTPAAPADTLPEAAAS